MSSASYTSLQGLAPLSDSKVHVALIFKKITDGTLMASLVSAYATSADYASLHQI